MLRNHLDKIIGVEDDLLDAEAADESLVIIGEGALMASLPAKSARARVALHLS